MKNTFGTHFSQDLDGIPELFWCLSNHESFPNLVCVDLFVAGIVYAAGVPLSDDPGG